MADDPTGMRGAQNRDGVVARGRQLAQKTQEAAMGWRQRRRVEKKMRELAVDDEVQKRRTEKDSEPDTRHQRINPNIDAESLKSDDLESFNRIFLDALRRGKSRTEQTRTAESLLRQVACNETFIQAIENCTIRTPHEQVDTEYAKQMKVKRMRLANDLRMARESKEFMLGELKAQDLDIIYATMLGTAEESDEEQKPKKGKEPGRLRKWAHDYFERRRARKFLKMSDEERAAREARDELRKATDEKPAPGAVELWRQTSWPEDMPRPHEAFFMFLEGAAIRERPDKKGEYIGAILKDLSIRTTFTGNKDKTLRTLVDGAHILEYLHARSSYPIDRAVERFHSLATDLLKTPTNQIHSATEVPGIGYDLGYEAKHAEKAEWVAEARQFVEQAGRGLQAARKVLDKAESEDGKCKMLVRKAKEKGSVQVADGTVYKAGSSELKSLELAVEKGVKTARVYVAEAERARDKANRELERRQDELSKFEAEASPAALAMELTRHFKSLLEDNREVNFTFEGVANKMAPRLPNIEIERILAMGSELVALRQEIAPVLVGTQIADAVSGSEDPKKGPNTSIAKELLEYRLKEYEGRLAAFEKAVENSTLPQSCLEPIGGAVKGLKHFGVPDGLIISGSESMRKRHGEPMRALVRLSVKGLAERDYGNLAGITDAEKIIALGVYEGRSGTIPEDIAQKEGKWKRFWQSFSYHVFTRESWSNKGSWLLRKTIGQEIDDLRPRNAFQKKPGRKPDGTPYKRKKWYQIRLFDGLWGLAWKGYIVGTALAGHMITTQPLEHWYSYIWPLNWSRPITLLAESINGGPIYIPNSHDHWYLPWSWTMPTEREREIKRVIHDHYDIPGMLSKRGDDYYRRVYGVGTRKLGGEQNEDGMRARLAWLSQNPDALRFLQERTSGRQDVKARDIGERPENCSRAVPGRGESDRAKIAYPNSCKKLSLNSEDVIAGYQPVGRDNWTPGMKVCCTIELTFTSIRDGLRLNTNTSDQFVDVLMAAARGGVKVDYAYITRRENLNRWSKEWFLVTPAEADIITNSRITRRENVQFLIQQGADTTRLILPMCAKEALSPRFLGIQRGDEFLPANRDEFMDAWRDEVAKAMPAINPLEKVVDQDVLETTFKAVEEAHKGWFADRKTLYDQRRVLDQVQGLDIQSQTALDVLVRQEDILAFVKQFLPVDTAYGISPGLNAEAFIQTLDRHKFLGESLEDFSPFGEVEGPRVRQALARGWIFRRDDYRSAVESMGREGDAASAAPSGSATPSAAPAQQRPSPLQIPSFSQAAQGFYMNPANEGFKGFVEGQISAMLQDPGPDGTQMNSVLASRFGNDQARLERAIKADIYNFLTSTSPADTALRNNWGLNITGAGDAMVVSTGSGQREITRTRGQLRRHLKGFCTRMGAGAPAPSR